MGFDHAKKIDRLIEAEKIIAKGRETKASGCGSLDTADVVNLMREIEGAGSLENVNRLFIDGFVSGLNFVSCPPESDMHGKTVAEFAGNAYRGTMYSAMMNEVKAFLLDDLGSMLGPDGKGER